MRAIILNNDINTVRAVYDKITLNDIDSMYGLFDEIVGGNDLEKYADLTRSAEYVFSTWGMPVLTEQQIRTYFSKVKALFYAAGSVQAFARPWMDVGVKVISAWKVNAYPVAEIAVSEILLAGKGFFYLSNLAKKDYETARQELNKYNGNYHLKVGILGSGGIGSLVIRMLKEHDVDIYCYSIDLTQKDAEKLGIFLCSPEHIFSECDVISNHLADNEQTKGIISAELIGKLRSYCTLINTGRGAQIDESALIEKLKSDKTITVVLDVTWPEPPVKGSPLYTLENVVLTPHFAGSIGKEVVRMARYAYEQSLLYEDGKVCDGLVRPEILKGMA